MHGAGKWKKVPIKALPHVCFFDKPVFGSGLVKGSDELGGFIRVEIQLVVDCVNLNA